VKKARSFIELREREGELKEEKYWEMLPELQKNAEMLPFQWQQTTDGIQYTIPLPRPSPGSDVVRQRPLRVVLKGRST
jgi:hypothetical protein